jgi:hypothetical protein
MEDLAGSRCGISPKEIYLNEQNFTKTSHCWGIETTNPEQIQTALLFFKNRFPTVCR